MAHACNSALRRPRLEDGEFKYGPSYRRSSSLNNQIDKYQISENYQKLGVGVAGPLTGRELGTLFSVIPGTNSKFSQRL